MKKQYRSIALLVMVAALPWVFSTCSEEDANNGEPRISYVRVTDPASSDSLLVAATLGNVIAIVGENLGETVEVWFNDQQAILTPTYISTKSIIVSVPSKAPVEITNKIRLVFSNGSELLYDFAIDLPAPVITSMNKEYGAPGETAVIRGDYFFEPITVTFTGGVTAEVQSVDQSILEITIPEGAQPGPITFATNFGSTVSTLQYKDQRNIILNYDDLTAAGSWRPGPVDNVDGLDGNYLKLFGTLNANQRIEDNFESQFWGHTRLPEGNLFEGDPKDFVLKFEARVVNWYGSYLQICWGPWDSAGNGEVWGNLNGRGLWRPWEQADANFTTNGEWITVSIPLTEMKYSHQQEGGNNVWIPDREFNKDIAGTLSFWLIATPKASASSVEIHIDNVRIVHQ